MDLEQVFKAINKKMLIDFEEISSQINHRGAKGKVRENDIILDYFKKYIPGNIGIANGEIVATDGSISPETDIILYEKYMTPLLMKENYQVFPNECIYGVVEVKSKLDKEQLSDAFKKINFIKKMPKKAFEEQKGSIIRHTNIYEKQWPYFPTIGLVVAFNSIDLTTLKQHFIDLNKDQAIEHRIDSVWVLNKGMLINWDIELASITPVPSKHTMVRIIDSDNPLMMFTVQLQSILSSAWMPFFMIKDYLSNAQFGNIHD